MESDRPDDNSATHTGTRPETPAGGTVHGPGWVWLNEALVAADQATVGFNDHGLTVGDGVFETLKVQGGAPFALTRHLNRLASSASVLGLEVPDDRLLRTACREVIEANDLESGKVRLTLTGGPGPMGSARGDLGTTLIVVAESGLLGSDPTSVVTVPWTRNEGGAMAGVKTTSYAENVVALSHAQRSGASEALFANTRGELCEGTGSNVFVVMGGRVFTPPLTSGCLAGVTRALVIETLAGTTLEVTEERLPLDVLQRADEIFVTSSTRDVQPVARVDDRVVEPSPGPVTAEVMARFESATSGVVDP